MAKRDFYEVLGLQKGADEKALKAAIEDWKKNAPAWRTCSA